LVVLAESPYQELAAAKGRNVLDIRRLRGEDSGNPPLAARSEDPAYLIYTSGSTGRPKGVLLGHAGAVNLACGERVELGIGPRHRILQFAPSSFDASIWEMLVALSHGACLVIAGAERVADPRALADYLLRKQVTVAVFPPSYLALLSDDDLKSLEMLHTAGEPPDFERALRLSGQLRYFNGYGPTEATVCTTQHEVDSHADYHGTIPIGHPIPNCEVFVFDRDMNLTPIGVPGEIYIGGRGLALRYLNQPALTAESFVPDPRRPGQRLFRSGDMGRRQSDGTLVFLGRKDTQVKVRGHRIELGEIERCLLGHPGVKKAVVIAHETKGSGRDLVAYFESDEPDVTAASLRDHLSAVVPSYMVPSRLIQLAALPVLPNGKVDREALPPPDSRSGTAGHAAPRNPREAQIGEIWRDVLRREGIGIYDRFFESGGDSIQAIQIVSRLRSAGYGLDMRNFFAAPTIAALATILDALDGDHPAAAPQPGPSDRVSLTAEEEAELFPDD
jgi:amino acid adenylation domain-containing protein